MTVYIFIPGMWGGRHLKFKSHHNALVPGSGAHRPHNARLWILVIFFFPPLRKDFVPLQGLVTVDGNLKVTDGKEIDGVDVSSLKENLVTLSDNQDIETQTVCKFTLKI